VNTPDHSHEQPELSIVIALLNEAESLPELYQQVLTALEPTGKSFEILFIDDGSRDGSFEIIRRMREGDKRIRAIQFRRNYGKSAALAVAFEAVRGEVV